MRVYRVEHKITRRGPFTSYSYSRANEYLANWLIDVGGCQKFRALFPSALEYHVDAKAYEGSLRDQRLAVRTLNQLTQWFNSEARQKLHDLDFVVRVYTIRTIPLADENQLIVYIPAHKLPVAEFSPLDIMQD